MDIDKALQENPDIYEYDNIYDDMQASKPKIGVKEKEKSVKERMVSSRLEIKVVSACQSPYKCLWLVFTPNMIFE